MIIPTNISAINVGIKLFYETVKEQNVDAVQVNWRPKEKLEKEIEMILNKIGDD